MLNMQDGDGDTFLHIAVAKGRRALVYVLATKMARCGSLDMKEHNGQTALQIATATNQHLIVRDLLEHGAQINTRDLWGRSPLHVCAEKGHFLSLQDLKSGRTCLHMASEEANMELFNLFLDQSSSLSFINVKTFSGNTALHIVSSLQNHKTQVEAVKLLMRNGADPSTRNFENELPCHLVTDGPVGDKVRHVLKGKYVHA
ncbi:NF-kappa-B inhibitor zeta [Nibea albiflora]|uniref:NF-kappa-B inhibitor zeta n=1 Tax=Nibea albiflora TaxID=240163 RepID=A0ACB7ES68_NIBAL|nr:NF-kappa-B inhibitor zeta [Nibea albiflora]